MDLWKLCDYITFVILELHFWDLVQCLLISFCFGSEILKKIGLPQPPKIPQKPPKTLRIYMNLWKLCDYVTYVNLELEVWDLVQWSLISFCLGSEILKKIRPPEPPKKPKKPQKKTYGFSRWDNLPTLWVRRLGFGTVFTNIILLWIRNFEENSTTPTPQKKQKKTKKTYGFSQWDNLPTLWFRRLGFGIVLSNIFLLWIWKFGEIRTTLTPLNPPPITMWDFCVIRPLGPSRCVPII